MMDWVGLGLGRRQGSQVGVRWIDWKGCWLLLAFPPVLVWSVVSVVLVCV